MKEICVSEIVNDKEIRNLVSQCYMGIISYYINNIPEYKNLDVLDNLFKGIAFPLKDFAFSKEEKEIIVDNLFETISTRPVKELKYILEKKIYIPEFITNPINKYII